MRPIDGELFDETLELLRDLPNVTIQRGYLSQRQLATLFRDFGVLLVPTRWDSQGVSREEALAAGLVPITSAVSAVPELLGEDEGSWLHTTTTTLWPKGSPGCTTTRSPSCACAAARRVRRQSALEDVVSREISLLTRGGCR